VPVAVMQRPITVPSSTLSAANSVVVPCRLTEARMTRARSTCLRCRLRSDVIASSRFLLDALTITHTVRAIAAESHGASPM
jgi:hypothetical protein